MRFEEGSPPNILIVDDTPANLQLLIDILHKRGYQIRPVRSGEMALRSARLAPPDLILLDVMMPNMDGYEVCRRLKADERTRTTPIIFISALDETLDKVKAFSIGGVDYITKPFQTEEVLARVETHLALRKLQKDIQQKNDRLEQEVAERKQAQAALTQLNNELEHRIWERTKVLHASEERYRTLFEDSQDAIFIITPDGQIVDVNTAYFELIDCSREAMNTHLADIFVAQSEFDRLLFQLAQHGSVKNFEATLQTRNNVERHCLLTAGPHQNEDNILVGYQGIIRDITDQKKSEAQLREANRKLVRAYDETLSGWGRALELRDKETEGHSLRVMELTVRLARLLDLSEEEVLHIRRGALLHDIGKMAIPDRILLKEGPLTDEEREIMEKHPVYAYDMLAPIAYLRPALAIPYSHHERWDGQGYPCGLKGTEIPLAARIFAIVDVWDALSSDRAYRPAWSPTRIKAYLREQAGSHFDPDLVEIFLSQFAEGV